MGFASNRLWNFFTHTFLPGLSIFLSHLKVYNVMLKETQKNGHQNQEKKPSFLLMSQGLLSQKIRFLA
jgi:hypothetical protein